MREPKDPAVEPTREEYVLSVTFRLQVEATDVEDAREQAKALAETLHLGGVLYESSAKARYNGNLADAEPETEVERA